MPKNRQKSFTIIETVISLGIFAIILFLIQFAVQYTKQEKATTNLISYHRMLMQLENDDRAYYWSDEKSQQIYFVSEDKIKQKIFLRLKNHILQLTTSDGGTMPMLAAVDKFKLTVNDNKVHFSLLFDSGENYETTLLLAKYQPKEE